MRHSKIWITAASVAIIIGIFIKPCLNFYADKVYVPQALEQFTPYSSSVLDAYFKGDVDETEIEGLATLFDNVEQKKHIPQTITQLKEVYQQSEDPYSTYATFRAEIAWNLSLAYLMNGQRKEAISVLDQIIKDYPQKDIAQQAKELKKKITVLGI